MIITKIIMTILQNTILKFCSALDSLGKHSPDNNILSIVAIEEYT